MIIILRLFFLHKHDKPNGVFSTKTEIKLKTKFNHRSKILHAVKIIG